MKLALQENSNSTMIMRRAGYGQLPNGSFARRLGRGLYPRFHVYVENGSINLHLDQKQASYEGSRAHSGEHDGDAVSDECERIRQVMMSLVVPTQSAPIPEKEEKKGFFGGLFG